MKICVVGLGFVGLTMATTIANKGIKVIGIDVNKEKCQLLKNGEVPFYEPEVDELLKKTIGNTLEITNEFEYGITNSEIIFVCVGTPSNDDGSVNLQYVKDACLNIGQILGKTNDIFRTIIIKSTVPPTTTNTIIQNILQQKSNKKVGIDFGLCMNPEFLKEGSAVNDMNSPHLIVIGADDDKSSESIHQFYTKYYTTSEIPMLDTNIVNAELIKYANNSFLATKISFINTIANICNKIPGANIETIAKAIGTDPRISPYFLSAGPGYGGSCFPKDILGFINFSKSLGYEPTLLESTNFVNKQQPIMILNMVKNKISPLNKKTVSILGISFKKNTDDIRESVSLQIIQNLIKEKVNIIVHDPMALENLKQIFGKQIVYSNNVIDCIKDSECCIILTEWDEYSKLTQDDFKKHMKNPCVIDTRRLLIQKNMSDVDYNAFGLG